MPMKKSDKLRYESVGMWEYEENEKKRRHTK
jgi:hypothetical protein